MCDQLNANAVLPALPEGPDGPRGHGLGCHDPAPPLAPRLTPGSAAGSGSLGSQVGSAGHSGETAAGCRTAAHALLLLSGSRAPGDLVDSSKTPLISGGRRGRGHGRGHDHYCDGGGGGDGRFHDSECTDGTGG